MTSPHETRWRLRRYVPLLALVGISAVADSAVADVRTFSLGEATLSLEDVTPEVGVVFTSLRFNRALNIWNVEVSLTNRSPRTFQGPLVLLVENFSGTSGALQPDGVDEVAKAFYDFSGTIQDGVLSPGEQSLNRTLSLGFTSGAPKLTPRVFVKSPAAPVALGLTRTLNDAGQPLPDVQVVETGPLGVVTNRSDPGFGVVTLGQAIGRHIWQFSAPGYLPVWRQQTLATNEVTVIPDPRLTRSGSNAFVLTPISGGQISNAIGTIQIIYPPGTVTQNTTAVLTSLTSQTLPGFLPIGWSPLQAFWLEFAGEPTSAGTATLTLWGPVGNGETAALARWNPVNLSWDVLQVLAGNGSTALTTSVPGSGSYSLVVPDAAPFAPPTPQLGQPLVAAKASLPDLSALKASGVVEPNSSPASRVPELVTGTATVVITNSSGPLPSGLLLRGEIQEEYRLRESRAGIPPAALGTTRHPPQYENFMVGYQRPGDGNDSTLHATFPLRPLLLFGAEELDQATVTVDVLTPTPFAGSVLDTNGGLITSEGIRVLGGVGDLNGNQAAQLRRLDATNFTDFSTNGISITAAFELAIGGVASGRHLVAQCDDLPTNGVFVLARVLYDQGLYGLRPVERLRSDSKGRLVGAEPVVGERLGGLVSAGQYLLLRLNAPQGLVTGIAHNSNGQPTAGLPVQITGQPWLAFSEANGAFRLLAPTGAVQVAVTDLASGDSGAAQITVSSPQAVTTANPGTASISPQVSSINPTNGAAGIARVTSIIVNFSKPVNPATLQGGGIQLLSTNGVAVIASLTLNLKNTMATLLPSEQLAPSTLHTLLLSTNITDLTGLKLAGPTSFTFTTESDQLNRVSAQFIIYEPTNGFAPVFGTPGAADPESPVILINETSGETATILSRVDGSFTNIIAADVEDFISATIVNRNGTRTTMPAVRQVFRDGSVGLFNGGGVIAVDGDQGPIELRVEPGSIATRTVLRMASVPLATVKRVLTDPPGGGVKVLGGVTLSEAGDPLTVGADISFPIDPAMLDLPPGTRPEDATFALAIPREQEDGTTVYQIIERMDYDHGKLVTRSPPFLGIVLKKLFGQLSSTKKLKLSNQILNALGLPSLQQTIVHELLLPLMLAQGTSTTVHGHVRAAEFDDQGNPKPGTENVVPGALVVIDKGTASPGIPGRLKPGDTFVTADEKGLYASIFPINLVDGPEDFLVTATHPAFFGQRAAGGQVIQNMAERLRNAIINLKLGVEVELYFNKVNAQIEVGDDVTPPTIVFTQTPRDPPPGTGLEDGVTVTVSARDDRSIDSVQIQIVNYQSLVVTTNPPAPSPTLLTETNLSAALREVSFRLNSLVRAIATVRATATDLSGNFRSADYPVVFAGDRVYPAPTGGKGPRVITSWPTDGSLGVRPGMPFLLDFSVPLTNTAGATAAQWLQVTGGDLTDAELSPDGKVVTVHFNATPGSAVTFVVQSTLLGANNRSFDQDPATSGDQSYTLTLTLAPSQEEALTGLTFGGGAVVKGRYVLALDRAQNAGAVVVYDLASGQPVKVASAPLAGPARDLALIPNWTFAMKDGGVSQTRDLLAVVGGSISAEGFQILRVFDVTDPPNISRVAGSSIALGAVAVTKLRWAAPYLAFLESGADVTSVGFINLQSYIIGMNATPDEIAAFPQEGRPGTDANNDGDFGDIGDVLPLPQRNPISFFGKEFALTTETVQRILDFDIDNGTGLVGLTLAAGFKRGSNGLADPNLPLTGAYRTAIDPSGPLDPHKATLPMLAGERPKRVALFPQVALQRTNGTITVLDLALVSVNDEGGATNQLVLVDISDPLGPRRVGTADVSIFGVPQTINRRADGLLALATTQDVLLLDPARLLLPVTPSGLPAALVGTLSGLGGGMNSFDAPDSGVNVVNAGGNSKVIRTSPSLRILTFPGDTPQPASFIAGLPIDAKKALLSRGVEQSLLIKSRLLTQPTNSSTPDLTLPDPNQHYYVRVDALAMTNTLDLAIEVLNGSGYPLEEHGGNQPPVKMASPLTMTGLGVTNGSLFPRRLVAQRMAAEPGNLLYNVFLAGPFVLSAGPIPTNFAQKVVDQVPRVVLRPGRALWVGIDPTSTAGLSPGSAATVAGHRLLPGASTYARIEHSQPPIIFIPGMAGSHLENADAFLADANPLPFGLTERWPGYVSALQKQLSLDPSDTQPAIVPSDAIRKIPEAFTLEAIMGNNFAANAAGAAASALTAIYEPLLKHLVEVGGYVEYDYTHRDGKLVKPHNMPPLRDPATFDGTQLAQHPNLFVYPYDWRRDNGIASTNLERYLELVRLFNPEEDQVDLVAHSNGGLVARRFIIDHPGVVRRCVTLGTPFLGAPKAVASMETGDFDSAVLNFIMEKPLMRKLAEYFGGTQQLLPQLAFFTLGGRPLVEAGWDLNENGNAFETYDYDHYKLVMDQVFHSRTNVFPVATNELFHSYSVGPNQQGDWRNDTTGVEYFHIFGVQAAPNTITQVRATRRLRELGTNFTDLSLTLYSPDETVFGRELRTTPTNTLSQRRFVVENHLEYVRGEGDGTVPVLSAARTNSVDNFNAPGAHLIRAASPSPDKDGDYEHNSMLGNPDVLKAVTDALAGLEPSIPPPTPVAATPLGQAGIRAAAPLGSDPGYRIELINAAPGTAVIHDSVNPNDTTEGAVEEFFGISNKRVTWLLGVGQDSEGLNAVNFHIPDGLPGGPFVVEFTAGELPVVLIVSRIVAGQVERRVIYGGRLFGDGDAVKVTIDSNTGDATFNPGGGILEPTRVLVGAEARDETAPATQLKPVNGNVTIAEVTATDAVSSTNGLTYYVAPDDWNDGEITTEVFQQLDQPQVDMTLLNYNQGWVVSSDAAGNISPPRLLSINTPAPDCTLFVQRRLVLSDVVVKGLEAAFASGWLLNLTNAKALEQGSGACLWRQDDQGNDISCQQCAGVYDPNRSDHDIELFLPCFISGAPPNLTAVAHDALTLAGDWYFRRPDDAGQNWSYTKPPAFGGGAVLIAKSSQTNFTPAEIIANGLNTLARQRNDALPEVSFFPVRYEYFTNAVLDLEANTAYLGGSDPIGDAGLGRQLLLLKWLLEGEYLRVNHPPINLAGEDLDTVWQRLTNHGIPRLEGFEWAELQQFNDFSSGFMLRTFDPIRVRGANPAAMNFLRDRTIKQVKTLGKAALRGAAALLAGADQGDELFRLSRSAYRQMGYRSFEEYVRDVAAGQFVLLGTFANNLNTWLEAKEGSTPFIDNLLQDDCAVNSYLQQSIQFLFFVRSQVFVNHEIDIGILQIGNQSELFFRTNNLQRLRDGFPAVGRSGLAQVSQESVINLELLLRNDGPSLINNAEIRMKITGRSDVTLTTNLLPASVMILRGNRDSGAPFFLVTPHTDTVFREVSLELPTPGSIHELTSANNVIEFATFVLSLTDPCDHAAGYTPHPDHTLFKDDQLSSPYRTPPGFDPGFQPGISGQFLALKFKDHFGKLPEGIFIVGSRTKGENTGDIDTVFITDLIIDRDVTDRLAAWTFFRSVNPHLVPFLDANGITGIGLATPDNPNPRGLGYDPDDIPKKGTVDTMFSTYWQMYRPGVRIYP